MHEVAETSSFASSFVVLPTFGLPKVSDWRELGVDHLASVVAAVHALHGFVSLLFILKLDINVTYHVVADVVGHNHLIKLTILRKFHVDLLVEIFKVGHCGNQVFLWYIATVSKGDGGIGVLVHVVEDHGLRQGWLVV